MADLINNYFQNKLKKEIDEINENLELIFKNFSFIQKYDVAGTYTFKIPIGVDTIYVSGIGGGGGGGGGGTYVYTSNRPGTGGGGGGAGSYAIDTQIAVVSGETLTITVGAGGAGGTKGVSGAPGDTGRTGGKTRISRDGTILFTVDAGTGGGGGHYSSTTNLSKGGSIGGEDGMMSYPYTGGAGGSITEFGNKGSGGAGGQGGYSYGSSIFNATAGSRGKDGAVVLCFGNKRFIDVEW